MTVISNVKQCLYSLKGIESQLSILALNSNHEEARQVFHETMLTISEINEELMQRAEKLQREEPQYKK
jgi:hypothetical protein